MAPVVGFSVEIPGVTAKVTPLLASEPTVTTTLPVVVPAGTMAVMLPALQDEMVVAKVPLNRALLVPWLAPKFVPVIVTLVPIGPDVGDNEEIVGVAPGVTVNETPLLATPLTVTTTLPLVAPAGTGTTMLVALHDVGVPVMLLLNLTVLVPWVAPKALPAIVTLAPMAPDVGDSDEIDGFTVNDDALLATPPTVTTTLPVVAPAGTGTTMVVAFHELGVAVTPLKVTVLAPWLAPKFVPVIVILVPTVPVAGESDEMFGVGGPVLGTTLKLSSRAVRSALWKNTPWRVADD
jgi:hypothetical protein